LCDVVVAMMVSPLGCACRPERERPAIEIAPGRRPSGLRPPCGPPRNPPARVRKRLSPRRRQAEPSFAAVGLPGAVLTASASGLLNILVLLGSWLTQRGG